MVGSDEFPFGVLLAQAGIAPPGVDEPSAAKIFQEIRGFKKRDPYFWGIKEAATVAGGSFLEISRWFYWCNEQFVAQK